MIVLRFGLRQHLAADGATLVEVGDSSWLVTWGTSGEFLGFYNYLKMFEFFERHCRCRNLLVLAEQDLHAQIDRRPAETPPRASALKAPR